MLTTGTPLPDFLVDLAACAKGDSVTSDQELLDILRRLAPGVGDGEGRYAPRFAVIVTFATAVGNLEPVPLDPLPLEGVREIVRPEAVRIDPHDDE